MEDVKTGSMDAAKVEMVEKAGAGNFPPHDELDNEQRGEGAERTTAKAWLCIALLTMAFGAPFWATPTTAAISSQLFASFGAGELAFWVIPVITTTAAVTILIFGANSDLFGRRIFLLTCCVVCAIGYAICAEAKSTNMLIIGLVFNGFGSGIAGVALIAVPELISNKWRHAGVVIADSVVYIFIVIGPIVGRYSILHGGESWRYLYWAGFAAEVVTTIGLAVFYFPPKHPRGVLWKEALKGLDWVGGVLYTIGSVLVLVGIVYTTYLPGMDKRVLVCLCVGFAVIVAFGCWENFSKVRFPLCPREVFRSHNGREFTVPFCLAFIVVGSFYGSAVIYPQMLNNFYVGPETSVSEELLLTLPASLPLVAGALCLTGLGRKVGHWKWSMTVSMASLTLWLALLALITPYNKGMMITFVALAQFSYGWAAYLSVTYTQLGVPQEMLGISGGLAGTARYAGGAVAAACYSAALARGISSKAPELIGKAVNETQVPQSIIDQVTKAAPGGELALSAIPGMTAEMAEAVSVAYKYAVAHGLRNSALVAMAFGIVGVILCFFLEDIEPKMTPKIEIFLENDALADKNKYH